MDVDQLREAQQLVEDAVSILEDNGIGLLADALAEFVPEIANIIITAEYDKEEEETDDEEERLAA